MLLLRFDGLAALSKSLSAFLSDFNRNFCNCCGDEIVFIAKAKSQNNLNEVVPWLNAPQTRKSAFASLI